MTRLRTWGTTDGGYWLTTPPRLHHIGTKGNRLAIVADDVGWMGSHGIERWVRRGLPIDGASVPWIFTWRYDPWDARSLRGICFHDEGYSLRGTEFDRGPRSVVDYRLLLMLRADDHDCAEGFYRAVRVGGWWSWHRPNTPLMTGYIHALKTDSLDEFIASVVH